MSAPPPDRPRVLIVEDDPQVRAYVETVLADHALIDSVGTASEAMNLASEQEYDCAVIDHGLPDLSGVELIRLLRAEPQTALLPLLLFTGQPASDLEDNARSAGADDFLAKPVDPDQLEERILELAQRSKRIASAS